MTNDFATKICLSFLLIQILKHNIKVYIWIVKKIYMETTGIPIFCREQQNLEWAFVPRMAWAVIDAVSSTSQFVTITLDAQVVAERVQFIVFFNKFLVMPFFSTVAKKVWDRVVFVFKKFKPFFTGPYLVPRSAKK